MEGSRQINPIQTVVMDPVDAKKIAQLVGSEAWKALTERFERMYQAHYMNIRSAEAGIEAVQYHRGALDTLDAIERLVAQADLNASEKEEKTA